MSSLQNLLLLLASLSIVKSGFAATCIVSQIKKEIHCRHARMKTIDPNHLSSDVTYFDYTYNLVEKLYNDSFEPYHMITILKLSQNKIEKIDTATFTKLLQLEYIDLSHNQLLYLDPKIFENNRKLKYVRVSSNPLFISRLVSPSLQTLIANNCQLFKIDKNTFSSLPNLQKISANKTEITPFGEDAVNMLKQLKEFTLQNRDCFDRQLYNGLVYLNQKGVANAIICDSLVTPQSNITYKSSGTISTVCLSLFAILSLSVTFASIL